MANKKTGDIEIGGRLFNTATGNIVAGADAIKDEAQGKTQAEINVETYEHVADIDAALQELSPDQTEALALATDVNTLKAKSVRSDEVQSLTDEEKAQAMVNMGVQNELALGAVYDVSAKNPTAGPNNDGKFESLSTLLSDANLNTLIPTSVRKGGMSIKFVQTSDNKYVQYRFMLSTFTTKQFTNVSNWINCESDIAHLDGNVFVKSNGNYRNFIKRCYVDSNNIDPTETYTITNVCKNDPNYGTQIRINSSIVNERISNKDAIIKVGNFYLIVDWSVIPDGYNSSNFGLVLNNDTIISKTLNQEIINTIDITKNSMDIGSTQSITIGIVNTNIHFYNKIFDIEIPAGQTFNVRITGDGTIARFMLLANAAYLTGDVIHDYCAFDTWYSYTAENDIHSIGYQTNNNPNATNVVFELQPTTGLKQEVEKNTADIAHHTADIAHLKDNFETIRNLFNPDNCSYFDAWGTPNNNYNTTGYIDVADNLNKTLYFSYNNGQPCQCRQMKLYNLSKEDITASIVGSNYVENIYSYKIENVNIAFIKCAISKRYLDEDNLTKKFQIECNNVGIHSYIEYGETIIKLKDECLDIEYIKEQVIGKGSNTAKLTSKLYLTDKRTDLFFSPLFKNWQFISNRFCRVSATGATIQRQFRNMITVDASNNGTLVFDTYDEEYNRIETKTVNTIVTPQSKSGNVKCLFIGSSITAHGIYENRLKTLCGTGFEAIGTRHASAFENEYFEAVGGWGFASFASYRTVKTTATSPFWHPSNGRYWGVVGFWKDVMTYSEWDNSNPNNYVQSGRKTTAIAAGFGQDGYISGSRLLNGDIMYDDTLGYFVQYNSSTQTWNQIDTPTGWGFDFVKYGQMWNISAPDIFIMAELSTNDFRSSASTPDFAIWNNNAESMFTALKAWKSDISIVMLIPISTFGENYVYGTEFFARCNYRMYQSRLNQIEHFDNRENENIYLIDDAIFFDEIYGYPISSNADLTKPNQEYNGTEKLRVQTDSPHPDTQGEYLLADGMFGIIQYLKR